MSYLTIYKASAGSGKTFTLAAKYTAFLLSGEDMAHTRLLAVTFTNKATGEMKERILQNLYDIAHGKDDKDDFLCEVRKHLDPVTKALGVNLLRKRAEERLSQLVHDYDHFAVQTIDSFFQSLLANLAHELGLAANFRVEINDKEVISRAVDNIMKRIATLPETASADDAPEVRRDRAVRKWVSEFISDLIADDCSWRISDDLKAFAGQLFSDAYTANEDELREKLADSQLLRQYEKDLRELERAQTEEMKALAQKMHEHIMAAGGKGEDIKECYKAVFGGHGFQWYWPYVHKALQGDLGKEASKTIMEYIDKGGAIAGIMREYEEKRKDAEVIVNSLMLSRSNINKLRLLGEIAREVDAINEDENHFMLAKTPILFSKLGDNDAPFVLERAGNRFEHVMIDEFQDTSPLQWGNFEKLLINNIAQGQECLLVGDVKQAIYRWRGGDWQKLSELSASHHETTHTLDTNYRSAEEVIHFNNAFFTAAPAILETAWPDDAKQEDNHRKGGYVRVRVNNNNVYEDLAEQIRLLQEVQGIELRQITMLLRNNDDANELIDYFRQNHPDLPLVSSEAFHLKSSRALQRLMAALRNLRDMGKKEKDNISQTYLLQSGGVPEAFTAERTQLVRMPLYELCERLVEIFHLGEDDGEAPFVFYFLDLVLEYLEENPSSLTDFIRYWEGTLSTKSIPGGEVEGIRIMTIHKSKGLAFHTVLIPFCTWPMERDRQGDILWCDTKMEPYNRLPVLPIPQRSLMKHSIYADDYADEHTAQRVDNLNLLYVAFTRAQQNLLVWGDTSSGTQPTTANLLAQTLAAMQDDGKTCATSVKAIPSEDKKSDDITYVYGDMPLVKSQRALREKAYNPFDYHREEVHVGLFSSPLQPHFRQSSKALNFLSEAEENNRSEVAESLKGQTQEAARRKAYLEEGVLLHEALSRIKTPEDILPSLETMRREGLVDTAWLERQRPFLTMRITSPKTRDWFSSRWQVINEQAIICPHPDRPLFTTRRPDRIITDGQRTLIIDFKFARPDARHVDQVNYYCQLLREMGFPKVEGYLWYVYRNEVHGLTQ